MNIKELGCIQSAAAHVDDVLRQQRWQNRGEVCVCVNEAAATPTLFYLQPELLCNWTRGANRPAVWLGDLCSADNKEVALTAA